MSKNMLTLRCPDVYFLFLGAWGLIFSYIELINFMSRNGNYKKCSIAHYAQIGRSNNIVWRGRMCETGHVHLTHWFAVLKKDQK